MNARPLFVAACSGLLLALWASPCAAARSKRPPDTAGRTIASITIESFNVFNTSVYPESKAVYRAANSLHRTTREGVVRRELLFDVGQPYDANLLRETERNLRALSYIRHANASAVVNSSGTIDVLVRTYDAWSLELIANFKRAGGTTEWKAGLTEHNVLGSGNEISAAYNQNGHTPAKQVEWRDTHFLGTPHLTYSMSADAGSDARRYAFGLDRPFYASIARRSASFTGSYVEGKTTLYAGDIVNGEANRRASELGFTYGVAVATSTERTRRVRAGVMNRHTDFLPLPSTPPGALPAREQYLFLQLGADWETLDFVTERRMQKFTHDEDYNVGFGVFPTLSWAPPLPALESAESQVLPGLLVRKGYDWEDRLLLLRASYTTKFINGANANRIAGVEGTFFDAGRLPRQTIAVHAAYDHGWNLDPSALLTLGETTGLRGYGLSTFTGDRRALMNLEDRIFLVDEWIRLLDIGAVVFYDAGWAWSAKTQADISDLRHSVGFGLRLAPSRSGSNDPLRIDFARALNPNGSKSRWTLSILAGHAFGPE